MSTDSAPRPDTAGSTENPEPPSVSTEADDSTGRWLRRTIIGAPRDLRDKHLAHRMLLVPLLAWVGLGADGLSSSAYGPEEAFRTLGQHTYLAVALAGLMATTVFLIAAAYSRIIEAFPQGGGGYVVASALLGKHVGVVSGCALLVDYILTITISIAAATDAIFSYFPGDWRQYQLATDAVLIGVLMILNIRGVKESVAVLTPIFVVFALTHLITIGGGILGHVPQIPETAREVRLGFSEGWGSIGLWGMLLVFMHAYSLGGGTYTGIEAVSNGLQILREPRVENGKRTMFLMATSLAFTATGLLLLYLLWDIAPVEGKTMNAVLLERLTAGIPGGGAFAWITILSSGALLVVAAQAGFMDGPRVLANMAVDSWVPRRFAALSERLTTMNGVVLMGVTSIIALVYTKGDVRMLVVLYSINVFLTFSLSIFGMLMRTVKSPRETRRRKRDLGLFLSAFMLCATILVVTTMEKFHQGGWLTLVVTGALVVLCFVIRSHYDAVANRLVALYAELEQAGRLPPRPPRPVDKSQATAVVLVGGYNGLGIHTFGNVFRAFPGVYKNVVFISAAVVDSGEFKGEQSIEALQARVQSQLDQYVDLAARMGVAAESRVVVDTDVVSGLEEVSLAIARDYPRVTFFAGKLIFQRERWYHKLLHNETALAVQKRLYWHGHVLVVLPARVTEPTKPQIAARNS